MDNPELKRAVELTELYNSHVLITGGDCVVSIGARFPYRETWRTAEIRILARDYADAARLCRVLREEYAIRQDELEITPRARLTQKLEPLRPIV